MSNFPLILVVEDNPTQQKLVGLLGNRCGFEPVICGSCDDLLEVLSETPLEEFKLVLMDWQLSGGELDGIGCTRLLRESESGSGRRVPIIGMTAYAMSGDREACMEAGMDDYLAKPFTIDQLQAILDKWLRPSAMAS
jgi:two-component system sensor histidine kinase/response regulator